MLWLAAILYLMGCSVCKDVYEADLEAQELKVETRASKLAFIGTVAIWPLIELHHLIFERGE
jgi:hypothetical protein